MSSKENGSHFAIYENMPNTRLNEAGGGTQPETSEDKGGQSKNSLIRIKCMVYTMIVLVMLLYVVIFALIAIVMIDIQTAKVVGNWTQWSPWTSCDVTCGIGSRSRFRTCTSGVSCAGNVTEIAACRLPVCSDHESLRKRHLVSFSARLEGMIQNVGLNKRVVFNEVLNNNNDDGGDSGIFKAPQSGVYLFIYFIEIDGAYGAVELRLNNKSVSATTLYGSFTNISISGYSNHVTFESKQIGRGIGTYSCVGGKISVSGRNNYVNINPDFGNCPYKDGVKATGGNSVVVYVNAGDEVWIQNSGRRQINVRPYGTTFTGILLT